MKTILLLFSGILILVSCHKGKHNPEACNGNNRRELKLLTDDQVSAINFVPDTITVTELGQLTVPEVKGETPRQTVELQLYTVTAKVNKASKESDGDYHIRLEENGNYLITECPNPGCAHAQNSNYLMYYENVKYFIEHNELDGKTVTITGVAFIDVNHHYKRKQAPNNMELHPIIAISF